MRKLIQMPFKPKVALAIIGLLVSWILIQMGYNVFHQLDDVPHTVGAPDLALAIIRDIAANHVVFERLFNGFIVYLLLGGFYHAIAQWILHAKLQRYVRCRLDSAASAAWKQRFHQDRAEIIVIKEAAFVAMSYGIWKPKVLISTGALSRFDDEEIEAILLHELYHCKSYHPLQMNILTLISKGLAFVPVIKDLTHYYAIWTELLADRYAISRMSTEVPIAQVLLALIKSKANTAAGAGTHFANEAVNYRIKQIIDPSVDVSIAMTNRKTLMVSVVVLIVMSLFLIGNCIK
jgi:beta-lactamase regulating signal transducer with metallopeptidase domain